MPVDFYENRDKIYELIDKLRVEIREQKEINKFNSKEIAQLKESDATQKESIDYLRGIIVNKLITIEINEKNIKELKDDLSTKKKI